MQRYTLKPVRRVFTWRYPSATSTTQCRVLWPPSSPAPAPSASAGACALLPPASRRRRRRSSAKSFRKLFRTTVLQYRLVARLCRPQHRMAGCTVGGACSQAPRCSLKNETATSRPSSVPRSSCATGRWGTGEDHSNDPLTLQSHDQLDLTLRRVPATVLVTTAVF
eukprot:COSAG05_NODE_435_length_9845_cov_24.433364_8_plen_166_part_00